MIYIYIYQNRATNAMVVPFCLYHQAGKPSRTNRHPTSLDNGTRYDSCSCSTGRQKYFGHGTEAQILRGRLLDLFRRSTRRLGLMFWRFVCFFLGGAVCCLDLSVRHDWCFLGGEWGANHCQPLTGKEKPTIDWPSWGRLAMWEANQARGLMWEGGCDCRGLFASTVSGFLKFGQTT